VASGLVVLRATAPSILEGHLTWLVNATVPGDHGRRSGILTEDQARIPYPPLDERGEDDAITRALEPSWTVDAVHDDDDVVTYVTALRTVTGNEPHDSPYVALARSASDFATDFATDFAAGILDQRSSPVRRRRFA